MTDTVPNRGQALSGPRSGIWLAFLAAVLFGASTPVAKLLVGELSPVMLAGLLYLGSGIGLGIFTLLRRSQNEAPLTRADIPWLTGAVIFGGILGPVLLMTGLSTTPASTSALLLNLEGVFTALLAWIVFRENVDRRIAMGFALIVAGGVVLSWEGSGDTLFPIGALAIVGASLCWAIDNNLTQKISASDPYHVAAIKGGAAGVINVAIGSLGAAPRLSARAVGAAMIVGFLGYGLSLAFFVLALRHLGTARTGAYFALAPFVGAGLALVFPGESLSFALLVAGSLMAIGVWLHLTELHEHAHTHAGLAHSHAHAHDEHHQHHHDESNASDGHAHYHVHEAITHTHRHYPDIHHRHPH